MMHNVTHFATVLLLLFSQLYSVLPVYSKALMSFPFYEGPLRELQESAVYNNKPVVVYFYENSCKVCNELEKETWTDIELIQFAQTNLLAAKKNLYTHEGSHLAEQYQIFQAGTILIFSPTGELIERISHAITPNNLLHLLQSTYTDYQPHQWPYQPEQMLSQIPTRSSTPSPESIITYTEVADYRFKSPKIYSNKSRQNYYSVIYTRVNRVRKIARKIKQIRRKWPHEVWVFAEQAPGQKKQYVIALGVYEKLELAEYDVWLFKNWDNDPKAPIKLNGLFQNEK